MRCDLTLVQARAYYGSSSSAWGGVLSFFHSSLWSSKRATLHFAFIGPCRASITSFLILFLCFWFFFFACCWTTVPFLYFVVMNVMQTQVTIAWESKKGDIIGLAASKGQDSLGFFTYLIGPRWTRSISPSRFRLLSASEHY